MPKQQSIIQECNKCGFTFTSYHLQPRCNECQTIKDFVTEFDDDSTDKPIKEKEKYGKHNHNNEDL